MSHSGTGLDFGASAAEVARGRGDERGDKRRLRACAGAAGLPAAVAMNGSGAKAAGAGDEGLEDGLDGEVGEEKLTEASPKFARAASTEVAGSTARPTGTSEAEATAADEKVGYDEGFFFSPHAFASPRAGYGLVGGRGLHATA